MQRRSENSFAAADGARALLVFSIRAVHYAINLPQCGADEGHMHERIGYVVACRGAEQAAAPMAVGNSQQFLCGEDRADRVGGLIDDASIGADIVVFFPATLFPVSRSPITIIYDRESASEPAIEAIAGSIAEFGLLN
jgi:hypothetical protein